MQNLIIVVWTVMLFYILGVAVILYPEVKLMNNPTTNY